LVSAGYDEEEARAAPRLAPVVSSPPLSAPTDRTESGSKPTSMISANKKLSHRFRLLVFISFPPLQSPDGF